MLDYLRDLCHLDHLLDSKCQNLKYLYDIKTQYKINSEVTILLHKTCHDRRRMHDFEIFKNKHPATLLQLEIVLDLGYLNFRMIFPLVSMYCHLERKGRKVNS
jgi:hypothetical protein